MIEFLETTFLNGYWNLDWLESTEPGEEESAMLDQLYAQMIGWA